MKKFILVIIAAAIHANTFGGSVGVPDQDVPCRPHSVDIQKSDGSPNVIIILSDDQGYGDFSCHGNPVLKTPALDKLYNESIRFGNFHVAPLCTPTRGELMTGLDAMHNKAATVLTGRNLMRRGIPTMPEVFSKNGYTTGIFGKWHLGDNYPDRPMDRGFHKCVWHKGWGLLSEIEYDNDYYKTRYIDSIETRFSNSYCTDLWFNKAIEWMDEMVDKKQPFFTYLALNAPHGPFYSPEEDYKFYRTLVNDSSIASFFGMIRNLDHNMERLENWLIEKNLKENTLIVFMNDNGGTGGVKLYNAGMRGEKGSNYEGGHRAACFIRWQNGNFGIPRTVSSASEIQDLLPTFVDLFGFNMQENYHFDGESLLPFLRSYKESDDRMFVVQYGGNIRPEKYFSCVVWDSWRLVGENELYDLKKDPGQENNMAGKYPEILLKMKTFYEKWWKKVEPEVDHLLPVIVGSDKENPVIVNSNNWEHGAVNTQWNVAQAGGAPRGGVSHIYVDKEGMYSIELSRWPFHLNRKLTIIGPALAIGGTKIRSGKTVPVAYGCISMNHSEPILIKSTAGATKITSRMKLPKGENTIQAWFKDNNKGDLCGAYYIKIEKIIE
jgi:arylsulfatase A-like enzyme